MTELVGNWLHFTARQPKRKRAELVCFFCHSKKIKCDLQSRTSQGCTSCSNCDGQGRDCRIRPSKRGKVRHKEGNPQQDDGEADAVCTTDTNGHATLLTDTPGAQALDGQCEATQDVFSPSALVDGSNVEGTRIESPNNGCTNPTPLHQTQASTSPTEGAGRSHDGDVDTGFLQVYGPENQFDAEQQELVASFEVGQQISDPSQRELQQSFSKTYFEYCYSWCPVLDRQTLAGDLKKSPLLANALALAASHIQPPLVRHQGPAAYYDKARKMFYNDEEPDALTALRSIALFYWWAPRPPSTAHRHSSWWWTSVIIRHAQQMNIHREPSDENTYKGGLGPSLRRRLWWTVYARERLTSLCQSKPCITDPDDVSIRETQLSDFPSDPGSQKKGQVFIHWVRLCTIMGKISKVLSRSTSTAPSQFLTTLRQELVDWVQALPNELQLPIGSASTESFDRDVHQLHLPYLTTIIILHLQRSACGLPQALPPALLAASCIARILRDILSRGNARFLMPITCWYCGTAFIALLQASRIKQISKEAEESLDILEQAVDQLKHMWASANVIRQGFERLRKLPQAMIQSSQPRVLDQSNELPIELGDIDEPTSDLHNIFDWTLLFPFATRSTSRIANFLLEEKVVGTSEPSFPYPENAIFQEELFTRYHDLLEPFLDYSLDLSTMNFESM